MLQSLLVEIFGAIPPSQGETVADVVPHKNALVLFEDNLAPVRRWQTELLKLDSDALRAMEIAVVCLPSDNEPALVNGHPQSLPVQKIRQELQGGTGKFEAVLVSKAGDVILRSDAPLTIRQIQEALGVAPQLPEPD
ncbi:MAG: hypothetical protein KJ947_26340 [Alphaproteobacteria bacterium]|jgi:hypothetical protein|nr:hypothetical protein [Alphaproteobacteria bacterium]MBU1553073.1 hypothetical protein [Alphaproteobacteria bacterium]MBU2338048.1 hypothetical protein [Alphaproteobacteria bacterium]MBU2386601.1 hypothetical protein [Alphaproteobacteria bacterium]